MTERDRRPAPASPLQDLDRWIGGLDLTRWPAFMRPVIRGAGRLTELLGPYWAYLLPIVIGAAVFSTAVWAFGEVWEGVREQGDLARLDEPVLQLAVALRAPVPDAVVTGFTFVGGPVVAPVLTVLAIAGLVIVRRSWTPVLVIVPAALGSLAMTIAGKRIFGRERPPMADAVPPYETSASFPSGHTLNAIVIAGAVGYVLLLKRRSVAGRVWTVAVAATYALGIGLSRVYLGHHWLTDVVAAWVLGAAWLAVVVTVHRLFLTVHRSRAPG
ncbi:phosphatase PAP2 family protein [Amnibacterium endophyticum]|uniref:Phosphatase PAP2 family protein n=1 Tax=Amnibacterium endophyticum TaxID=2109337 RepID=A0ABW4LF41_9MICO